MSVDSSVREIGIQAAQSLIATTLIHWVFKRSETAAIMSGALAATICIADAILMAPDEEVDDEEAAGRFWTKAIVTGLAIIAIKALLKKDIHWKTTILTSGAFFYSSHYFIWLR